MVSYFLNKQITRQSIKIYNMKLVIPIILVFVSFLIFNKAMETDQIWRKIAAGIGLLLFSGLFAAVAWTMFKQLKQSDTSR